MGQSVLERVLRGRTTQRGGLEDNRDREEIKILREFWQLYILRDGRDLSCVTFGDYVVEMVLESFFVGGELGHALGEVDVEGGEAIGFEVDLLMVGDLPDCAGKGGKVSQVVGGSMEDFEISEVGSQSGIVASINSVNPLTRTRTNSDTSRQG